MRGCMQEPFSRALTQLAVYVNSPGAPPSSTSGEAWSEEEQSTPGLIRL